MIEGITFVSVAAFFAIFCGLFCVIYFLIIIFNFYQNSYRPQETTLVLFTLITLFIINAIFLSFSFSRVVESISESFNRPLNNRPPVVRESLF